MSRVGKDPVVVPSGVEVKLDGRVVNVKGKNGKQAVALGEGIEIEMADGKVQVVCTSSDKPARAMFGTVRALIQNAVQGVSGGYTKQLEIQGVGYRAQLKGKTLVLSVGFCHTVELEAPEGITFTVPEPTKIEVAGADKQQVGQVAANIRAVRKPEPYKGKGIRYAGEQVRRKAGKQGK